MLVFIDESGDPGRKLEQGSSRLFVVALIVFNDHDEAEACDQRITLLRRELGWKEDSEFHFSRNSDRQRCEFLQAVAPYDFFYYGIVLDKDPKKLWGPGFDHKESLYKFTCRLVFENARDKLQGATVIIDESGNREFKSQLERYLKNRMTLDDGTRLIRKVNAAILEQQSPAVGGLRRRGNQPIGRRTDISWNRLPALHRPPRDLRPDLAEMTRKKRLPTLSLSGTPAINATVRVGSDSA